MKLNKGDKVVIKNDLNTGHKYGGWFFNDEMARYKGKKVTIKQIVDNLYYKIEEDTGTFGWTDAMFELEEEFNYTLKNGVKLILKVTNRGFTLYTSKDGVYEHQFILDASTLIHGEITYHIPDKEYDLVKFRQLGLTTYIEPKKVLPTEEVAKIIGRDVKVEGNELVIGCSHIPLTLVEQVVKQMKKK